MPIGGPQTGFKLIRDTVLGWGNVQGGIQGLGQQGDAYYYPAMPLQPFPGAKKISVGSRHGMVLGTDKNIYASGWNNYGQFGNNNTTDTWSFVQITTDNRWLDISAGSESSYAIRDDNTLWATGYNGYYALGLGDDTNRSSWTQVGSSTNWAKVVSAKRSYNTAFALKTDGTLWGWGTGTYPPGTISPILIGGSDTFKEISQHRPLFAIRTDGTLWGFGHNDTYQLGNGTNVFSSSLIQIGSASDWSKISAGQDIGAGIKTDGTVWVWGANLTGELGLGTSGNYISTPVQQSSATDWYNVFCAGGDGQSVTHAIKTDGTLWKYGTGTSSPIQLGSVNTWKSVDSGNNTFMGIATITQDLGERYVSKDYLLDNYANLVPGLSSPGLFGLGYNFYGQLGVGDTVDTSSPVQVGSLTDWKTVETFYHTMAIKKNGTLWGWGYNGYAALGDGTYVSKSSPIQIGSDTNWQSVSVGLGHTMAIKNDGTFWAIGGDNRWGSLGGGTTANVSVPVQVGSLTNWKQVSCSIYTMAVKTDGTLWALGKNHRGQLGLGDTTNVSSPTQVGSLTNWKQVSCGYEHTMAIKTDGTLWAFGYNRNGGLGLGDIVDRSSPVQVGTDTDWSLINCGYHYSLAIKKNGTLWACGYNDGYYAEGQLGLNDNVDRSTFVQVGNLTNWKTVSAGVYGISSALKTDGTAWAWGSNWSGLLGQGDTISRSSPVQIGSLTTWKHISRDGYTLFGIKDGYI